MRLPVVDVFDTGEEFTLEFELPGLTREDVEITTSERGLLLQVRSRKEPREAPLHAERAPFAPSRLVPLPAEVQTGRVNASFKEGILTVSVPKKQAT